MNLGDVELEILNIVWDKQEASVNDVLDTIKLRRDVAYTTVMTILSNLAKKGFLDYRKDGRSFIYFAKVNPNDVKDSILTKTMDSLFKGSSTHLIQHLVSSEKISKEELNEIQDLIKKMKKEK